MIWRVKGLSDSGGVCTESLSLSLLVLAGAIGDRSVTTAVREGVTLGEGEISAGEGDTVGEGGTGEGTQWLFLGEVLHPCHLVLLNFTPQLRELC
jgi:hypothetical protein